MLGILILDLWDRWYYGHDVDMPEGGMFPERWIVWGTIRHTNSYYDHRYFVLMLPFVWRWDVVWDCTRDVERCAWHHPCFFWRGQIANFPESSKRSFFWHAVPA